MNNFEIGMTAPEVVADIVSNNPIDALLFLSYKPTINTKEGKIIAPDPMLRLLHHQYPKGDELIWLKRDEITKERQIAIVKSLPEGYALAVTSLVTIVDSSSYSHLPMMDFDCTVCEENLRKIQEFLMTIDKRGVILSSGRSYHFYGVRPISQGDWKIFNLYCQLFTGFVDTRYVTHRLFDGHSSLRVSSGGIRPALPQVVSILL